MYYAKEEYGSKEKLKEKIKKNFNINDQFSKDHGTEILDQVVEKIIDISDIEESINFDIKKDEFYEKLSNSVVDLEDKGLDRDIIVRYDGKFNGVHMESRHYVERGIYIDEELRICGEKNIGSMKLFTGNAGSLDIGVNDENVTLGYKVRQDGEEVFFIESKTDENNFMKIKIEVTVDPKKLKLRGRRNK